ncbi:MAG: hypothetical protein K1060chlam5_00178 [Candidatus Anoxychlamydiales bacterium]|nr:hypothetical protein [Candidatus Anoxychlamydiales bacterium]
MTQTTFNAAKPYAIASLATGAIGLGVALTTSVLALKIIGIAAAIIGSVALLGTVICGFVNMGNPVKFKEELPKFVGAMVVSTAAEIIKNIALELISSLLDQALGRQSVRVARI